MRQGSTALAGCALFASSAAFGQGSFVNWESLHVHPIDLTSDGARALIVNTADNRLEVFTVTEVGLSHTASIPVGLDPVSVRARTANEAWVANHVSDSLSIVDLDAGNVVATLYPGDEPADIVFAGPHRAFVSVSSSTWSGSTMPSTRWLLRSPCPSRERIHERSRPTGRTSTRRSSSPATARRCWARASSPRP